MTAIDPGSHPEYITRADHPFVAMDPERRVEEIDAFCGRLWARSCDEKARTGQIERPQRKAA